MTLVVCCISSASYYNKNPQISMISQLILPPEQSNMGVSGGQRLFIFLILRFSPFWLVADPTLVSLEAPGSNQGRVRWRKLTSLAISQCLKLVT